MKAIADGPQAPRTAVPQLGDARPLQWLVRLGFIARGLTYGIIGALALALALGVGGGSATNQQGALALLASAPLGKVALVAVAAGLLAYALWKFTLALVGTGLEGAGGTKPADRVKNLAGGVVYCGFLAVAVRVLTGSGGSQSAETHQTTAGVLGWPGGQVLVAVAGLVFVAICAVQIYDAVRGDFLGDNKTGQMTAGGRRWFSAIGRIGLISRALVFAVVGYFLIRSAVDFNAGQAVSLDGALRRVAEQPYGSWLLGLVALGLVVFAGFSFTEARYRRL